MTDFAPILRAVRQAALLCRRVQEMHVVGSDKGIDDPVTIADYGSQVILARAIGTAYPDEALIAEEQSRQFLDLVSEPHRLIIAKLLTVILDDDLTEADMVRWLDHGQGGQTERTWVIDPVDGTKGFIANRHYAIGVGVLRDGIPTEGVIGAPGHDAEYVHGTLFYTEHGVAYAEPINGGPRAALQVSERENVADFRLAESVESAHRDADWIQRARRAAGITAAPLKDIDSMEKYGLVADGEADLYLRLPRDAGTKHCVWDHAAGVALAQTAGGRCTDLDGSPLDFSQGRALANRGLIIGNGRAHERIVRAVLDSEQT